MKFKQTTVPALGRQKPKGRKNSTLNTGQRRLQAQFVKKKKKKKKAEKYYRNGGTNQKHRSPSK